MSVQRYIFFDALSNGTSLETMRVEIDKLEFAVAYILPAPEAENRPILYVESSVDEEFSADIWYEAGDGIARQIEMISDSLSVDISKKLNGMLSIIYNNEDSNMDNIHEQIEHSLKELVSGVLYDPETGEIMD